MSELISLAVGIVIGVSFNPRLRKLVQDKLKAVGVELDIDYGPTKRKSK
jgi:large-conductance mechanosensitive channel